jgi:dTDP-4-amino-4,6-dideoxygalactose transaminase
MKKALHIAASPNTEFDDVLLAFKMLVQPWKWKQNNYRSELNRKFSEYFEGRFVYDFDSSRSALFNILKAYEIGKGDEVIMLAFSCLVVANPIIWSGAKPIYVDINKENFNYDLGDLRKKLTKNTKAIIIQHSFGIVEDIEKIREIVGNEVVIIEDLAHGLGVQYQGRPLGMRGDAAIITFGIEKIISGVRGGLGIVRDEKVNEKLKIMHSALPDFPLWKTIVALKNPIFWYFVMPLYYLGFGKFTIGRMFVWIAHITGLLGNMIEDEEYKSIQPKWLPTKMSNPLANLAIHQWKKIEKFSKHRREIVQIYSEKLGIKYENGEQLLRFPILVEDRSSVIKKAKSIGVTLGDWYKKILYAPKENLHRLGYKDGDCPNTEYVMERIVNLPTFINVIKSDAKNILKQIAL